MTPLRGEVWTADLGITAKQRAVIVISRDDPDPPRALVIYVPVTSKNRGSKYEVALPKLPFFATDCWANTQGVASAAKHKFLHRRGKLDANTIAKIEAALKFAVGITD